MKLKIKITTIDFLFIILTILKWTNMISMSWKTLIIAFLSVKGILFLIGLILLLIATNIQKKVEKSIDK